MTIRDLDEKFGGYKPMILAFLHGEMNLEESHLVRTYCSPHEVTIIGIQELMNTVKKMGEEIINLKRGMNAG